MQQRQILSLEEVTQFVPNVSVASQTLGFSVISFRGLAGGFDRGFEQSVARYVDGVYSGRVASSSSDLGDVARVEILRGPQGTLFGNNSITGTFNILTNMPDEDEFQGEADATVGEDDERRYSLMLTGPITNTLSYRLYGAHREIDGYLENQASELEGADKWMGATQKDDWRTKLLWRASENLDLLLSYSGENGKSNSGLAAEMYVDRPVEDLRTRTFDLPVWPVWQTLVPDIVVDRYDRKIAHNTPANYHLDTQQLDLTANYQLGEHTLTSITAYSEYDLSEYYDNDFSPANFLVSDVDEKYSQYTQEFRITSPGSEKYEYVAGIFLLSTDLNLENNLLLDFNDYGTNVSYDTFKSYKQDYSSAAAYGQYTYHLSPTVSLTGGLRYSQEEKKADIDRTYENCIFLGRTIPIALECSLLPGISANGEIYQVNDKLSDSNFSPMANVSWAFEEDWNSYARIATGYKSGGFSSGDNFLGANENQFEPETSINYELGLKGEVWGGSGRINAAIFYTELHDLQVSSFTGVGGFSIGNAASATTTGFELDSQFALTQNLTVLATLGYTHARYDDYENAGCTVAQTEAFLATADTNVADYCVQDLSGDVLFRAPDWNASIGSKYVIPTSSGFQWLLGLDLIYSDQYFYAADLDPVDSQGDYFTVNCQLGIMDEQARWQVTVRGVNLTDEDVYGGGTDLPLVYGAHGGGLQRQTHWAADFIYRF